MSNSVRPQRRQPTRLPHPWDSPGKNTGVGCHFLLQCRRVKSESEVTESCLTLSDPMNCGPPGSSVHGIFQARVLEWGAIAFSKVLLSLPQIYPFILFLLTMPYIRTSSTLTRMISLLIDLTAFRFYSPIFLITNRMCVYFKIIHAD